MKQLAFFIGSMAYLGFLPGPRGTYGSLVAWLGFLLWYQWELSTEIFLVLTVLLFFVGAWCSGIMDEALGTQDSQHIIVDEWVGQWIASYPLLWEPLELKAMFPLAVLSLILFRWLDIKKPFGIKAIEHIAHPYGVMLDDVAAGLIAAALISLLIATL